MRTKRLVAMVAALLLMGSAACTGGDGGSEDGRITLRFQSLAWQEESVDVNKELVKEWNATHPDVKVEYVQGSWGSVHDQLLTSFEGGEAPDIIHDASDDLADFAYGGYLADLRELLPERLKSDIPQRSWETVTFGDGIYGVPFLQEPRVLIANAKWLRESGVRIPTPERPWSWDEFRAITDELGDGDGKYGVAWPLKEPVSATLNLSLSTGGQLFHRGTDGKVRIRFEAGDQVVPRTIHDQVNTDGSASSSTLGSGGSDTLPGFFGGKYAMVPLGFSYRQQIVQQAPKGFEWQVLPAPAGADGLTQGVSPRTVRRGGQPAPGGGRRVHRLPAPAAEHGAARARRLDAADRYGGAPGSGAAGRGGRVGGRGGACAVSAVGAGAVRAGVSGMEGQGGHACVPGVLQRGHWAW